MNKKYLIKTLLFVMMVVNTQAQEKVSAKITAKTTTYKVGQLPKLDVVLTNNTSSDIYLIGAIEGSEYKMRYPHCYIDVELPNGKHVELQRRCGLIGSFLEKKHIIKVASKGTFNPYKKINEFDFDAPQILQMRENFKQKGTYKIQFFYATPAKIESYGVHYDNSKQVKPLLAKVPVVDIKSNVIELTYE